MAATGSAGMAGLGLAAVRKQLSQTLEVTALRLPVRLCNKFRMALADYSLVLPRTRVIIDDDQSVTGRRFPSPQPGEDDSDESAAGKTKLLLLAPEIDLTLAQLPEAARALVAEHKLERVPWKVVKGYELMTVQEVLDQVLPEGLVRQSAFSTIGHIAHMNLRTEVLPYKKLIGDVILDKNTHLRTVVNKVDTIDNTYRNFAMEVIAGEPNTVATVRESGCTFTFDFAKVYWNSRLATEHERLVSVFSPSDVIADMFAGVGPFALPAAKMGATVYANDLNPASAEALAANAKANHVDKKIHVSNADGRDFIRDLIARRVPFTQVAMNLPAIAPEFLDVFIHAFPRDAYPVLPRVHCYCFSTAADTSADVLARVTGVLTSAPLDYSISVVRSVAPHKDMMRISFSLPPDTVYAPAIADTSATRKRPAADLDDEAAGESSPAKKAKGLGGADA
ncbi:tRNA (guanine-N(1)-)-methyltransferase [Thecamonas trahens ATCC 50062]|uniref:tRNA (guanine(37)-N1)-methyltransferase n=1 Tax=Thecamonas trahens ATCC 50062 TaxID=461836 RepID=A0A0L0D5X4_THETB|nr:tRNA (guanine-N(1)-)-methyltransferase [Thecamonas trahens ATCC 50062]KNC47787.1 tRNA (guanine-N(1)-)-methyltransferase [Thecamonas trahens ATCC 50062]|eukprot:XP_013759265.1 tRNA (guanine-N(1)-)-methyltransferase [Thecamonas trahens ATCC 50062]